MFNMEFTEFRQTSQKMSVSKLNTGEDNAIFQHALTFIEFHTVMEYDTLEMSPSTTTSNAMHTV